MAAMFPNVTISPEILRRLPSDSERANALVNDILEMALGPENAAPDDRLENRPDWQEEVELGRRQRAEGKVISHEDVLNWTSQQP